MKLKMEKAKHDHKLTNLLKVALFTLLMFLPFINVAIRSAYVVINKNAYQSYYGETVNESKFNEIEEYKNINDYYIINNVNTDMTQLNTSYIFTFTRIIDYSANGTLPSLESDYYSQCFLYSTGNGRILRFVDKNNVGTNLYLNTTPYVHFENLEITITNEIKENVVYRTYNKFSYLDNVFEYSINQLEQNPLYNWALNTGIYTGIATMTGQLGITTTVIPMILTYWLMLTVIYIIIDIVIQLFVYLTHIFSKD